MTVKELIDELNKCQRDKIVYIAGAGWSLNTPRYEDIEEAEGFVVIFDPGD